MRYGQGDEGSVPFVPSTTSPRLYVVRVRVTFPGKERFLPDQAKVRNCRFFIWSATVPLPAVQAYKYEGTDQREGVPHSLVDSHRRERFICSSVLPWK